MHEQTRKQITFGERPTHGHLFFVMEETRKSNWRRKVQVK